MRPAGAATGREMVVRFMTGPGKGRRVTLADIAIWSKDNWPGWLGPSQADVLQTLRSYLCKAVKEGFIKMHPAENPYQVRDTYSMAE